MKCPNCKSENTKHEKITDNNGVCGPGYNSWVITDYYVCQECGVMFKNVDSKHEENDERSKR